MAGNIEVILNHPRVELLHDGWGKSKLASAMKPAVQVGGVYVPGKLSDDFWREPNTGVLMLSPLTNRPDYYEENLSDLWNQALADFHTSVTWEQRQKNGDGTLVKAIALKRPEGFSLIELLIDTARMAILAAFNNRMIWVLDSKTPLAQNEGFAVWVYPPGLYTERAVDYMIIGFGRRYVLHIRMNGTAALWSNGGTEEDPEWVERVQFDYAGGGVDHGKPFQITVIPWGFDYITFLFSQHSGGHNKPRSSQKSAHTKSFLYSIFDHEPDAIYLDTTAQHYIKTPMGSLTIGVRTVNFQYEFAVARVRYPASATLTITPETLPELKPQGTPSIVPRGFEPASNTMGNARSSLVGSVKNNDGSDWVPADDTELTPRFVWTASEDLLYTPELWSCDLDLDAETHTPDWEPVDVSAYWQYLRFKRSTDPTSSGIQIKLERQADFANTFRPGGPLRINIGGVTVADGYITDRQPTPMGPKVLNVVQIEALDMWVRLDEKLVSDYKFLDKMNLLEAMVALIKRAGFTDDEIEVDDPDEIISAIDFGPFVDPNDPKALNTDATVGDFLREVLSIFGSRPIRVRWTGEKWRIYMAPSYDQGTPPTKIFYLDGNQITVPPSPPPADSERFSASQYYILSDPEFTSGKVNFNGLIAEGVTGTSDGAEKTQSLIPWIYGDPDSVNDPEAFWFTGKPVVKRLRPPEMIVPQHQEELDVIARTHWDRYRYERPLLEFEGEWQPEIDADDFIWVIGIDDSGDRVSYGAYRIEHINIEIDMDRLRTDNPEYDPEDPESEPYLYPQGDVRWAYSGSYTCVYVGPAVDEDTPMFTEVLPEAVEEE